MQRLSEGSCRAFLAEMTPASTPLRCPCSIGQAIVDRRFMIDAIVANHMCYRSKFIRNGLARRCCYSLNNPGYGSYVRGPRNANAGYIAKLMQGQLDTRGHTSCCNPNTPAKLCVDFYNKYPSGNCLQAPRLGCFALPDEFVVLLIIALVLESSRIIFQWTVLMID